MIEAKATHTPTPDDARGIIRLRQGGVGDGDDLLVHRVSPGESERMGLVPGVAAVSLAGMHAVLRARGM